METTFANPKSVVFTLQHKENDQVMQRAWFKKPMLSKLLGIRADGMGQHTWTW